MLGAQADGIVDHIAAARKIVLDFGSKPGASEFGQRCRPCHYGLCFGLARGAFGTHRDDAACCAAAVDGAAAAKHLNLFDVRRVDVGEVSG